MPKYPCFRVSVGVHGCFIVIDLELEMPTKLLSLPLGFTLASQWFMFGSHARGETSITSEGMTRVESILAYARDPT